MFLEAAIFLATLSYVIVASRQLKVMRDTLTQQQAVISQNRELVDATKRQADTARQQAELLQHEAVMNAAVLTLGVPQVDKEKGIVTVFIENWGKEVSGHKCFDHEPCHSEARRFYSLCAHVRQRPSIRSHTA